MIDKNKEVAYFVAESTYEVQVLDNDTYDDDDDSENDDGG